MVHISGGDDTREAHVIGILGGMGPAATADFFSKLTTSTQALTDQEHRHVVIWSDPTVPDRSDALAGLAPDPTPWLLRGAVALRNAGATLVAIPCNTAHAFVTAIAEQTGVEVVHMIAEVATRIARDHPAVQTVGLLATTGTLRAGLYQSWLDECATGYLTPNDHDQENSIMRGIRAVKAGQFSADDRERLLRCCHDLIDRGAQAIIAACTEIPLVISSSDLVVPLIDPAQVLAEAVLRRTEGPGSALAP